MRQNNGIQSNIVLRYTYFGRHASVKEVALKKETDTLAIQDHTFTPTCAFTVFYFTILEAD